MTIFSVAQKKTDAKAETPMDRFEARLEAMADAVQRPISRRFSPFERVVRNQSRLQEV